MGKVAMSAIFKAQKKRENSAMEEDKGRGGGGRRKRSRERGRKDLKVKIFFT